MQTLSIRLLLILFATVAPTVSGAACPQTPAAIRNAELAYWTWALGASGRQMAGHQYFVMLPDGTPNNGDGTPANPVIYTGSGTFSVPGGTALVLPLSMWIGEGYTRASTTPDDDPGQPPAAFFTAQSVTLDLDGHTVIDSRRQSLACQYMPAAYFEEPIRYRPAQYRYTDDRGIDVYASAALWVKGLATIIPALPPGQHAMHLHVDTLAGWGYDNTWTFTVTAP